VQVAVHNVEVSCAPLSVVTVVGMPKRATQLAMKASAHVLAQGWCAEEPQAACEYFPSGTAGSLGTLLPLLCPHPSTQNVRTPFTWWHICQGVPRCEWRVTRQVYPPLVPVAR
jgi:hypothetical protein